jgi:hypothetical protein
MKNGKSKMENGKSKMENSSSVCPLEILNLRRLNGPHSQEDAS